jgi:hypothetical protein
LCRLTASRSSRRDLRPRPGSTRKVSLGLGRHQYADLRRPWLAATGAVSWGFQVIRGGRPTERSIRRAGGSCCPYHAVQFGSATGPPRSGSFCIRRAGRRAVTTRQTSSPCELTPNESSTRSGNERSDGRAARPVIDSRHAGSEAGSARVEGRRRDCTELAAQVDRDVLQNNPGDGTPATGFRQGTLRAARRPLTGRLRMNEPAGTPTLSAGRDAGAVRCVIRRRLTCTVFIRTVFLQRPATRKA